jgi:hypothetical protein
MVRKHVKLLCSAPEFRRRVARSKRRVRGQAYQWVYGLREEKIQRDIGGCKTIVGGSEGRSLERRVEREGLRRVTVSWAIP